MKTLVIVAHPDDEVLAMGGTIRKLVKEGHQVKIIFMATGIFARRSDNYKTTNRYDINSYTVEIMNKQVKELRSDAKKANQILGVRDIEFVNFPDNEMDKISNLEITKKIEQVLASYKPNIVFTHTQYDINVDHRAIYNATITATRPTKKTQISSVISFEVPSSTEWYFPSKFSPNIFVDVTKELNLKLKALKAYKNEIRRFPHPRSAEALEVIAKRWGTIAGFFAAEAFCLVREFKKNFKF